MIDITNENHVDHIVSYSGGMGSFAEAYYCVKKYGKDKVRLLFCDTLMEDEDLYRFLQETVEFLDVELVKLCYGMTPWELFSKHKFVANSRVDLCSRILKRERINGSNGWINTHYGYTTESGIKQFNCHVHVGIDSFEKHRLDRLQERMAPKVYRSLLVETNKVIEKDFSEQFGIKKPRLYQLGFSHNNCGGFCVKAGLGHFKLLYEKLPERYKYHEEMEQKLNKECNTLPFLRKIINGKAHYVTLKEYRETYLEPGLAESDKYDIGGCSCAIE